MIRLVLDELHLSDGGEQLLKLGIVDRLAGRRVLQLDSERALGKLDGPVSVRSWHGESQGMRQPLTWFLSASHTWDASSARGRE